MHSTTRLYCSEVFRSQDFGLKDKRLSPKRVPSCYIAVWTEFAIAKFHCSHIRGALDINVYFKGFAFAAYWLCNRQKTDSHFITWLSFTSTFVIKNNLTQVRKGEEYIDSFGVIKETFLTSYVNVNLKSRFSFWSMTLSLDSKSIPAIKCKQAWSMVIGRIKDF